MIELNQRAFASAIALAQMPLERRNTVPILGMVRCRANGAIYFEGTDLDVQVTARLDRIDGKKKWKGQFMIPEPSDARNAIATVGGKTVSLSYDDGKVRVSAGPLSLSSATVPAEDFPDLGTCDIETWSASLSPEILRAFERVAIAMSREETRYYLNGIYLHHVEGWNYRAVATDGHRLSILEFPLPDAVGKLDGVIIPRKAIGILLKAAKSAGPLALKVGSRAPANAASLTEPAPKKGADPSRMAITFDKGDITVGVVTKLIDGTYPDYRRVVPTYGDDAKHFQIKATDLRRAIQAVSVGSSNIRAVKIAVVEGKDLIRVSRASAEGFSATIDVPCQHNSGAFEVGFNGQYLLDLVTAAAGDEILLSTADSSSPALVRNPADTAWTGILMPMRV